MRLPVPPCALVDPCVLCQLHPVAHEAWRWIILKQASVATIIFPNNCRFSSFVFAAAAVGNQGADMS